MGFSDLRRAAAALSRARAGGSGAPSAIATMLAGIAIGEAGFLGYAAHLASANNDAVLKIAAGQAEGGPGGAEVTTTSAMALTAAAPLTFVIGTPLGWLATYLAVTGLIRSVAAAVGERRGDPAWGLMRRAVARAYAARREARAAATRESWEGPEVADRLVPAERLGIAGAVLVVVASRRKGDWTPGTVLACGDRYFLVGDATDRHLPTGLRTLYPLTEVPEAAVLRRVVAYTLPPLTEGRSPGS